MTICITSFRSSRARHLIVAFALFLLFAGGAAASDEVPPPARIGILQSLTGIAAVDEKHVLKATQLMVKDITNSLNVSKIEFAVQDERTDAGNDEASPLEAPNVIGLLSDLTGTNGANGDSCREGYELARKSFAPGDTKGKTKLSFLFGDHKGEPKTGTSEFLRMVNQSHAIAVVSNRGNVGMALDPISARLKIPLIGIMGHTGFIRNNPVGYRFWPSPKQEGSALAKAALRLGKRVASLDLQDEYILSIVDAFKTELTQAGGKIVFSDSVSEQDTDWASLLTRMRSSKPDVILLNTTVGKLGALVRRAREIGLTQPIISNFWLSYPSVAEAAGTANIEGSGFVALDTGKAKFLDAFKQLFPASRPNAVTLACFSGLAFLLQNIPDSGEPVTAEILNNRLRQASEVQLLDQAMKISDREAHFDLVFETYRNGTPVKTDSF